MLQKFKDNLSKVGFLDKPKASSFKPSAPISLKSNFNFVNFALCAGLKAFPKYSQPEN